MTVEKEMGCIASLIIQKLEANNYQFNVSYGGETLYSDAGFTSIEAALIAASEQDGPVDGFEVAYGGIVVGTYLCAELKADAAGIAELAVERQATFR